MAASGSWSEQLHQFLNGRLRTTSYKVAVKQHPLVLIPQVPLHTQHIVDGIALAIVDRGDRCGRETFLTICNHLKSCWGRWLQVMQYVTENAGNSISHEDNDAHQQRRFTYGAMAALQDVLLAWYVVDAVLKLPLHTQAKSTGKHALPPPVVCSLLLEELATLLPHHMPLFCMTTLSTKSPVIVAALLEYWHRFEDMITSWYLPTMHDTLQAGSGALRRCEEVVKRHLLTAQNRVTDAAHSAPGLLASMSTTTSQGIVRGSARTDLMSIIRNALAGGSTQKHHDGPSNAAAASTTSSAGRPTGKALVDIFIQQAFERSRTALSCKQCGALFPSEGGLMSHYATHFSTKEQRDTDTAVRLRFPSVEDALQHCPFTSRHAGGASDQAVKFFCKTTEAHRPFFLPTVAVRKPELGDDGERGSASSAKRPRGTEGVVITDIATMYHCVVCREMIRPMQDVFSRDWVLPHCVQVGSGVAHEGCRVA